MKIVIFGYGEDGAAAYRKLMGDDKFEIIGFADNSIFKQGNFVNGLPILSIDDLIHLRATTEFSVIIAAREWFIIGEELENAEIGIYGVYKNSEIAQYNRMSFDRLDLSRKITLYAGDICDDIHMANLELYGLSINKADARHILHDITNKYPLPDNSIYSYLAEDVLEHIEYSKLIDSINEIFRILKKGSLFRICLPDYNSPYLNNISMKSRDGKILFDPTGGGQYKKEGVVNGGHKWFPNYSSVKYLLDRTKFKDVRFLCYRTKNGDLIRSKIDFSKGHINRISSDDQDAEQIYSIVVDCYK